MQTSVIKRRLTKTVAKMKVYFPSENETENKNIDGLNCTKVYLCHCDHSGDYRKWKFSCFDASFAISGCQAFIAISRVDTFTELVIVNVNNHGLLSIPTLSLTVQEI